MVSRSCRSAITACLAAFLAAVTVAATVTGCAGSRSPAAESHGVDFSQDTEANFAAAQLGMRLMTHLPRIPGYAGLQIVSSGVEVSVVGEPSARMRAAVARYALKHQGRDIPVHFRSVRNSEEQLTVLANLVGEEREVWAKRGIELTSWGTDMDTNTVEIRLARYSEAARAALIEWYGDRVTVDPHDHVVVPADG